MAQDEFAEEVVALVHSLLGMRATRLPDFMLRIELPNGRTGMMNLATIYAEVHHLRGEPRARRLRTAVLALAEFGEPPAWQDASPRLRPAVRAISRLADPGEAVSQSFVPFLRLACTIDSAHGMVFVLPSYLQAWGVSADAVFERARTNMGRMQLIVESDGPVADVMGPDGYVSSWLAAPAMLAPFAGSLGSEVVALAPSRDRLTLLPTDDADLVARHIARCQDEYQAAPRQLSPVPYILRQKGIEVWDPPPDHPARQLTDTSARLLAQIEYAFQAELLEERFKASGKGDVHIARYTLVIKPDRSSESWALWIKQAAHGLLPPTDMLVMLDDENRDAMFAVHWNKAMSLAAGALTRDPEQDPPRWRYSGWPDAAAVKRLREVAVPFPPRGAGPA